MARLLPLRLAGMDEYVYEPGDTVELLWEIVVETAEGNVYTYPTGTRLTYLKPGTINGTADLNDGAGNVFAGVSAATFVKV